MSRAALRTLQPTRSAQTCDGAHNRSHLLEGLIRSYVPACGADVGSCDVDRRSGVELAIYWDEMQL